MLRMSKLIQANSIRWPWRVKRGAKPPFGGLADPWRQLRILNVVRPSETGTKGDQQT
jgi:hypothetical protein